MSLTAIINLANLNKGLDILIYILGPIGSGKTTLTHLLAADMGAPAYYEDINNGLIKGMLQKFYSEKAESRRQYSAMLQVAFLTVRYEQLEHALSKKNALMDSNLESDGIMSQNLYDRGEMDKASFNVYHKLNQLMQQQVDGTPFNGLPDLSIYLHISFKHELEAISHRNRLIELRNEDKDYYRSVNQAYEDWSKGYHPETVLTIDRDQYDFVNNHDDQVKVLDMIEEKLVELGKLSSTEFKTMKENRYGREEKAERTTELKQAN